MTNKTSRLNVRLTPGEHAAISCRAAQAGLSISEYLRRCALRNDDRPVIKTDVAEIKKLYVSLKRAGSNLNQCARELNTHHRPSQLETELEIAFNAITKASTDVSTFITDARSSV